MAPEFDADDWEDFRKCRTWHYNYDPGRFDDGEFDIDQLGIFFPKTDLLLVTNRLKKYYLTNK